MPKTTFSICHPIWVIQAYDLFLFLLFATFLWSIYLPIKTTSIRPIRGNSNQSLFLLVWLKCLGGPKFLDYLLPLLFIVIYPPLWWKIALDFNKPLCSFTHVAHLSHLKKPWKFTKDLRGVLLKRCFLNFSFSQWPRRLNHVNLLIFNCFSTIKNGNFIWYEWKLIT